jgi:hypothetical protein
MISGIYRFIGILQIYEIICIIREFLDVKFLFFDFRKIFYIPGLETINILAILPRYPG